MRHATTHDEITQVARQDQSQVQRINEEERRRHEVRQLWAQRLRHQQLMRLLWSVPESEWRR